jgi:hypothetical protein
MSEDAPRELSLAEIDDLSMQAIEQITARLPLRDYRTAKADDGSSSHVMEFGYGERFEVIYDRDGRPVDFRADRVRCELLAGHIVVSGASSRRLDQPSGRNGGGPDPGEGVDHQLRSVRDA